MNPAIPVYMGFWYRACTTHIIKMLNIPLPIPENVEYISKERKLRFEESRFFIIRPSIMAFVVIIIAPMERAVNL